MTIYDWPYDKKWQAVSGQFRLSSISALSSSPYSGAHKASLLAQLWVAHLTFHIADLSDVHDLQGFLDGLEGPVNPVRIYDRWRPGPRLLTGSPEPWSDGTLFTDGTGWSESYAPVLIAAVAQGERVLVMEGLPASAECFRRGDLVGVQGYLYELKFGASANASGEAAVTVQPGMRVGAAIGDPVTLYRPTLAMRLASDAESAITRQGSLGQPFNLTFVEDVP